MKPLFQQRKIFDGNKIRIARAISNYPGYFADKVGNIYSARSSDGGLLDTPKKMSLTVDKHGYYQILLRVDRKRFCHRAHRIIAQTFLPNPENKPMVNHRNGIKTDNRIKNLEWCTQSENEKHAYKTGLKQPPNNPQFGENNGAAKTSKRIIKRIRKLYDSGKYTYTNLAVKFELSETQIGRIVRCEGWSHI